MSPWLVDHAPYRITVDQYRTFHHDGFIVLPDVLAGEEVAELIAHTEDVMYGRCMVPGLEPPPSGATTEEIEKRYVRIHQLHRLLEIHERYLLHPRVLDVLEVLIGPDVMAMQTMLFLKPPGANGQGYHQDSFYIPTSPDKLCGAWIALDAADEENGCLWMTPGSQNEPIYPPVEEYGFGTRELSDITAIQYASHTDENVNGLTPIARRYPTEVSAVMRPGDAAFFGGHILHRSHANRSKRFRRAFVGHYSSARSFTQWEGGNQNQILARGDTTLPFAQPKFGTICAANQPRKAPSQPEVGAMMEMPMATDEGFVAGVNYDADAATIDH